MKDRTPGTIEPHVPQPGLAHTHGLDGLWEEAYMLFEQENPSLKGKHEIILMELNGSVQRMLFDIQKKWTNEPY